jgi:hypothetical protein
VSRCYQTEHGNIFGGYPSLNLQEIIGQPLAKFSHHRKDNLMNEPFTESYDYPLKYLPDGCEQLVEGIDDTLELLPEGCWLI